MNKHLLKKYIDDRLAEIQVIDIDLDKLVLIDCKVDLYCKSGQIHIFYFDNKENAQEGMKLLEQKLFSQWEEEFEDDIEMGYLLDDKNEIIEFFNNDTIYKFQKYLKDGKVKIKARKGCILIERIE